MSEQNRAIARRAFVVLQSQGNVALVDELVASDYLGHTPFGEIDGVMGVRQCFVRLHEVFIDLQVTIEDQIAEGDKVVTRWTARATYEDQDRTVRPSSRPITLNGITIFRIADSKIIESWTSADRFGILQQSSEVDDLVRPGLQTMDELRTKR